MKKIILIMINILIITTSLFSQNAIDPQVLPNNILNLNSNAVVKNNDKFTLGWNYGSPNFTMDTLLKINYSNQALRYYSYWPNWYWGRAGDYPQNQKRAVGTDGVGDKLDNIICLKAYNMYYEPTINVDTTNTFIPNGYNTEGAGWSWLQKDSANTIWHYPATDAANRGQIKLRKSVFTGNTKVLWDVYPKNELYLLLCSNLS